MNNPVLPSRQRQTAQVRFPDGATFEAPIGTPLHEYMSCAYPHPPAPIMAAIVDGELEDLWFRVTRDVSCRPIDTSTNDGNRVYQRSVCFLLVVAVRELIPAARVVIDHSVTLGGFFCRIEGRPPLGAAEIVAVEERMRAVVEANERIDRETMSVEEARQLFSSQGYDDKVRLLAFREARDITVYTLGGVRDYFYGYLAPDTGCLRWFSLEEYPPGFVLRLPRRTHPTSLPVPRDYPKLMGVFREADRWIRILGIRDMGALNEAVESGRLREAILVAEALHEKNVSDIADSVVGRDGRVRVVLIAGPSSSGKTTFARRLAIQLQVNGLRPFAVGLDDYFVNREDTPRDDTGEYDFEALEAIDLELFNEHLLALMAGEQVRLPHYDFQSGMRQWGEVVSVPEDAVLIVEGIHGLNPELVASLPPEAPYRVYVSALTQLNIDHHNRVPTTDTRLLRRIVRDARSRGYSAQDTIQRWESVRRGEERNIFPYQENADVMFNSALIYELTVLKPYAEPLLFRVPQGSLESLESRRLLAFLRWVRPCPPDLVPDNSLLKEFIGGSILEEYTF